jgi:hypothetical protein
VENVEVMEYTFESGSTGIPENTPILKMAVSGILV